MRLRIVLRDLFKGWPDELHSEITAASRFSGGIEGGRFLVTNCSSFAWIFSSAGFLRFFAQSIAPVMTRLISSPKAACSTKRQKCGFGNYLS